jgi:hypothetical protein
MILSMFQGRDMKEALRPFVEVFGHLMDDQLDRAGQIAIYEI